MNAILWLILSVLDILTVVIFVMVIMSWLITFNVVNLNNRFVYMVWDVVNKITEPLLGPIRRIMPNMGGLDISPVILLLGVYFLRVLIVQDIAPRLLS
ncbi:MAG: YggT family protein [Hyphomicrobiales bacterium]